MSVLYSKLRLEVPSALDGQNAIITSSKGTSRTVEMSSPITDVMLAGMDKYRVQAGITDEDVSFGYGQIKRVKANYRCILKKLGRITLRRPAVVLNNEIHVLGTHSVQPYNLIHYKWDNSSWVEVSTLPYDFEYAKAVVLNNEIHVLGGGGNVRNHYKWNGTSWTSVSTLPYDFDSGSNAVVLNDEIHILGGSNTVNYKKHYKWNGSSWISVSTLPYEFYSGSAIVFNNQIHILGSLFYNSGYPHATKHYKWNGSSWTSVSTLPYIFFAGSTVVFNNQLHLFGRSGDSSVECKYHYKWNGSSWTSVSTLPYKFNQRPAVVWNDFLTDNIVIFDGLDDSNAYFMYPAQWDGTSWTIGTD